MPYLKHMGLLVNGVWKDRWYDTKNLAENLSELKPNLEILLITIVNLPLIAVDIIFMYL